MGLCTELVHPSTFLPEEASEEPGVELSDEQRDVIAMILNDQNVFFTGSAGTGKSVLLRQIIRICQRRYSQLGLSDASLAITASTGLAAVNIGGGTLHSWAGIGLGKEPLGELIQTFLGEEEWRRRKRKAWNTPEQREMFSEAGIVFDPEDQKEEIEEISPRKPKALQDSKRPQNGETIRVKGQPRLVSRWRGVRTLLIDESERLGSGTL